MSWRHSLRPISPPRPVLACRLSGRSCWWLNSWGDRTAWGSKSIQLSSCSTSRCCSLTRCPSRRSCSSSKRLRCNPLNVMSPGGDRVRLEARVAEKSFRTASGQSAPVIADLSFALEEGETGALIGPSGCGKSTLLRILAGLDRNFEGSVHIPTHGRVGMVFQEPRLLPWRSVEDNVRLAAPDASEAEVAALFAALGLSEHRTHFPGELSIGLARRAALARAFAVRPTLLLLDEPFVSLDAPLARQLQRDLARLVESRGMITVLVTHDVDEAIALADRIYVLCARPAHVVGEIKIAGPRAAMSREERKAVAARIEALREAG